jgi:hypothetical protein
MHGLDDTKRDGILARISDLADGAPSGCCGLSLTPQKERKIPVLVYETHLMRIITGSGEQ